MMENKIKITPPVRCATCGTKTKNMQTGWLGFRSQAAGVVLFACPNCHAVYTNVEAAYNNDKLQKAAKKRSERRIVLPQ